MRQSYSDCYKRLVQTRLANLIKKSNKGKSPAFSVGQYVLLKNDNLRTIQGSRQLITPICRDIYQIITVEKGGFAFRILNTRNRSERTVIYTELRNINLKDVLMMEIDPKKFMQNAGKIIRQNSFKRGNSTALRLLDMSQGNLESQENPQTQPPHRYETVDKEGIPLIQVRYGECRARGYPGGGKFVHK